MAPASSEVVLVDSHSVAFAAWAGASVLLGAAPEESHWVLLTFPEVL